MNKNIVVGLDIGTSKICAIVASAGDVADTLNIHGIGITESEGSNRGVITHIEKTTNSIQKVIDQAEQQSGYEIKEAYVGIAGDHIESFQTRGIVGISNPTKEISAQDVERVIEECKNISMPAERKILHLIPQEFILDGQDGITDPIGMIGTRMEAIVHIVTGQGTAMQNIHRCVERLDVGVKEVVLEPIASSYAVLCPEEKEVGVALIDIGGGTTDIAIFEDNIIRFTKVIALAGRQVTDDIRKGLGIMASYAEKIKREYGHAYMGSIMNDDVIMIPGIGGRRPTEIKKTMLCQIIQPRMEEIFEFALSEIRRSGFGGSLGAGIVITGGCSLLKGADELAQDIFGMPVKIGMPSGITYSGLAQEVNNPIYSTAVGLALYGLEHDDESSRNHELRPEKEKIQTKKSFLSPIKRFFEEL